MGGFKRGNPGALATVVVALVVGQGCAVATYQDAKLVGKGKVEFTPTVTRFVGSNEGETESLGNAYGGMITAGLSDKVDLIAGYSRFKPTDSEEGSNHAGLGPKFSLAKDMAALVVPVTFAFGDDVEVGDTLQVSPTAVFSVPLGGRVTFNPGAKVVWSNCDGCDVLVGAQAGFTVPIGNRVMLRPEVSALRNPGESGTLWSFGVGLSLRPR